MWKRKSHTHTQSLTHRHTDTHIRTHTHTDTHSLTHRHTDTHIRTHTHTDTHSLTHTHTHTLTYTHTHTHTHTLTHTLTMTLIHTFDLYYILWVIDRGKIMKKCRENYITGPSDFLLSRVFIPSETPANPAIKKMDTLSIKWAMATVTQRKTSTIIENTPRHIRKFLLPSEAQTATIIVFHLSENTLRCR